MADSSNMLDLHHQAEELLLLHGSSALEFCNQDPLSYPGAFIPSINTTLTCPRDDIIIDPFFGSHMVLDPGLQYAGGGESFTHLAKIKEELFDSSKLDETHQFSFSMKHEEQTVLSEFKCYQPALPFDGDLGRDPSTVLQSVNFPSPFLPSAAALQTSSNMDLQALELFSSVQLSDICRPPAFLADMYSSPPQGSSIGLHKMPASSHGVADARRPATGSLDQLKPSQGAAKKPRMESRSAVSPFKVRKEKLGDRIAALQQLVAPFGKTDTASVLMEAIGYIKFLQDQVETLSVPYMRPSSNTKSRKTEQASNEEGDDPKPDLRSRGLCLVPLACTTYVTNDSAVWLPPNFRGST